MMNTVYREKTLNFFLTLKIKGQSTLTILIKTYFAFELLHAKINILIIGKMNNCNLACT